MSPEAEVRKLRSKLDHPVVDGDGHVIESMPLFFRYLAKFGGSDMPDRYREELRRRPTGPMGDREPGDAPRLQHPAELAQRLIDGGGVLEDVLAENTVGAGVG